MAVRAQTDFQRINACAKRPTDIWTNYLYYTFSLRLVYIVRNTRITPNGLTLSSLLLVLGGCVLYALGHRTTVVLGLILVQISYVVDCADGQLARYRQQYSPIGGWLDQTADRIKEFAIFFSLAYGYTRLHSVSAHLGIWMWAMLALFGLYLLEYLGQIDMFRTPPKTPEEGAWMGAKPGVQSSPAATAAATTAATTNTDSRTQRDSFSRAQRLRSLIPFRSFIIGEQYFAMLVFLAFGAIYPFIVFTAVLGLMMAFYRPVVDYLKYRRQTATAPREMD